VGSLLFGIALVALLLALTQSINLGWTSPTILALIGCFVLGIACFALWESHTTHPALDLTLFRNRLFDFSLLAATLQSLAMFSVQFLVVFYMQAVRGYSPLTAALLLVPMPIATALAGPLGGWISDRVGASIPATVGLLIQAAALFWLSTITATSPYEHIAIGLALTGFGGGLFFSPNTSAAMSAAPSARLGVAAAALATFRNVGMVTSLALGLAVAAGSLSRDEVFNLFLGTNVGLGSPVMLAFVQGMQSAFHASIVVCLAAAAMSLVRGPETRQRHATAAGKDPTQEPAGQGHS
jgi:MFS family permease